MEKVFLKSTSQEIVIKGSSKEGHTDVFAYDYYDDDDKRKLGGLYIIGNVNRPAADIDGALSRRDDDSPDITYVTNLVASLAKREYYSRPDISPRDAFSATLKKINDVVEEFFSAKGGSAYGGKGLKMNIGIFAVAGEQILISKLGKFKIVLGRESRTVDILNNVDLFSKEQVEEKEFSNIVSGKIMAGDKLFAFYPNRMVTAREKAIKADLLRSDAGQFAEKINSVKETKPDFDCGALYLSIDNHKELAVKKPKPVSPVNLEVEVPRIISSEFSLGRKVNPLLASILAPVKMARDLYGSWRGTRALKGKFILLSFVAGVLVVGVVLTKMLVVIDPERRKLNAVIDQTQNNLKLARTKIDQNDLIGARQLLVDSLSSIYTVGLTNDRTEKTTEEVYGVLDDIDKAVDVSPSLLESMPEELNQRIAVLNAHKDLGIAMDIYENNLYVLTPDNILKLSDVDKTGPKEPSSWLKSNTLPSQPITLAVDGNIYIMNSSGTLAVYYKGEKASETNTFLVSSGGDVLLTSKNSDKLYLVNKTLARIYELDKGSKTLLRTLKVGSSEPFVDAYLYGDNTIIITTRDNRIWEIK
ncbi:hypothetical protein A3G06_00100 [Candidatus Nomurabacteria bacterium RIFCSPLOWO2_12_FULL_46_14]|uniref:Uncharacterized protein n=1 Tax=Candidatus Nomurabacteria bacterium RIFCSPLOWO2_12_FULL_46_14 TaxID=1801797 RepID=A0A1F6YA24_9BACT|nr:MAG: hypothetical protein A3G06_00100 [Candidatus Nomurabacteria bacterium RIFCSPLOWO2_12_FULL_46_14]HXK40630.1 hypothetical protein [Candidatus Paceibacterota bacterium]